MPQAREMLDLACRTCQDRMWACTTHILESVRKPEELQHATMLIQYHLNSIRLRAGGAAACTLLVALPTLAICLLRA